MNTQVHRTSGGSPHRHLWNDFGTIAATQTDRHRSLTEMARSIANQLEVDACSIYAVEPASGDLVLTATMGLNQSSVGQVRMKPSEGLTGLVAETQSPVFVDDAGSHPRFQYFPEAGEDPFVSFVGVPILLAGQLRGVLVVQTVDPRDFALDGPVIEAAAEELTPFIDTFQPSFAATA